MATTTMTSRLIERLLQSEVGQKLQQEDREQRAAERERHLQAFAQLKKQAIAELPGLVALRGKAEQERTAALEAVRIAQQKFNAAFTRCQSRSTHFGDEIEKHKRALTSTCDPCIDQFVADLDREAEHLRHMAPETSMTYSKSVRNLGEIVRTTNRPRIVARLAAVVQARSVVQELKWSSLDGEPLKDRLAEIWVSLPRVEDPT
jgi:hypothetical protein